MQFRHEVTHEKERCHMQFRHEVKHEISSLDILVLRQRLRAVMKPDSHAGDGHYEKIGRAHV